ncbi:hypothetical protein [Promicromonospora sp. NPDC023805]|uniref:hypothetical protein n=1 Tax=Promicromonospora sp. NPDC023805 TaxID=3154696 RepID=UPI0033F59634
MHKVVEWLKHWCIALAAVVVGGVVLGLSWIVGDTFNSEDGTWWESVLANVGAAILLVAPIAWASDRLTRQVEGVRENVEEVRVESAETRADVRRVRKETSDTIDLLRREVASLRDLGEQVSARRTADEEREVALYRRLGLDGTAPDRDDVVKALRVARETGVVNDRHGPRAELVPYHRDFLGLSYEPNDFGEGSLFFVVPRNSAVSEYVTWDVGVSTADAVLMVTKALRSSGVNPRFDAGDWFRRISETLVVAASHIERHRIIQLCAPQWVVTSDGIVPYPDRALEGLGPTEIRSDHATTELKKKEWVDADSFDNAVFTWRTIFGHTDPWGAVGQPV